MLVGEIVSYYYFSSMAWIIVIFTLAGIGLADVIWSVVRFTQRKILNYRMSKIREALEEHAEEDSTKEEP